MPLVVKDKYDQQPYSIRIPNLNGIIAIEFDDETKGKGRFINSNFKIKPYQQALKGYFQTQVNQLLRERDWTIYVDFDNLPKSTMDSLHSRLRALSSDGYKNNFAEGVKKGIYYEALAQLASAERPLMDKGYKISSELSSLSMFIIFS